MTPATYLAVRLIVRRGLAWRAYMAGWTGGEFSRGKRGALTLEDLEQGTESTESEATDAAS